MNVDGLKVSGIGSREDQIITIHQIIDDGLKINTRIGNESKIPSFCSEEYEKLIPCYTVSYEKSGASVRFITLLEIGKVDESLEIALRENELEIVSSKGNYIIELQELSQADFPKRISPPIKKVDSIKAEISFDGKKWNSLNNLTIGISSNQNIVINLSSSFKNSKKMIKVEGVEEYFSNDNVVETSIPYFSNQNFKIFEQEDYIPIFGYHKIIPDDQTIIAKTSEIHQSKFEEQIAFATNVMECNWITMSELTYYLKNQRKVPKSSCVINFDDSTLYQYIYALPILEAYHVKATFYTIVGEVGIVTNRMTWSQLDRLIKLGHDIESHTYNVTKGINSENLSGRRLFFQLLEPKRVLEDRYNLSVETFAYPLGEWNKEVVDLMSSTGYKIGRDTSKDNTWRDVRAVTVFTNTNLTFDNTGGNNNSYETNVGPFHMFYYKPELKTFDQIYKDLAYNTWWQFEENYKVENGISSDVRALSSINPTNTSHGVISLEKINTMMSTPFILSRTGDYYLEIVSSKTDSSLTRMGEQYSLKIDERAIPLNVDTASCTKSGKISFCSHIGRLHISAGKHELIIQSKKKSVYLDKFRLYREITPQKTYNLEIIETTTSINMENKEVKSSIRSIKRLDAQKKFYLLRRIKSFFGI